jgi:ABC-type transporter Mla maintaining outer membrane lipid asymmetry permease subunit MlaE
VRMYLGHFTNRVKSFTGFGMFPTPKTFGDASKSGFFGLAAAAVVCKRGYSVRSDEQKL